VRFRVGDDHLELEVKEKVAQKRRVLFPVTGHDVEEFGRGAPEGRERYGGAGWFR
jgi:hypothetical protein